MGHLLYQLNARDEISSVNEEWVSFARENQGISLLPPQILGRSIWDFITDLGTREIYRQLHDRVRTRGAPVRFQLRCDSPARRRLLELTISAEAERGLTYRVLTTREEERAPVPLLDATQPRSERIVTTCGWCKRVLVEPQGWLEVEEAVDELALFEEVQQPELSHGICDDCGRNFNQLVDEEPG